MTKDELQVIPLGESHEHNQKEEGPGVCGATSRL